MPGAFFLRILVVQESDWIKRGPHQQHHLIERMLLKGHQVRVIDFEIEWDKNGHALQKPSKRLFELIPGKSLKEASVLLIRPTIIRAPLLDYFSEAVGHSAEILLQLRDFEPDVVIGLGIVNAYIGCKLARRSRIPFVYYLIDSLDALVPTKYFRGFARKLVSQTLTQSDHVIVINSGLQKYATELGAEPSRVTTISAGVDLTRFNPLTNGEEVRASLGIGRDEFVMFFMGWLYSFSGLKEVATAMLSLGNESKLRLLVLGRGELLPDLQRLRVMEASNKLILEPWRPYEEIPKFLASSDVCLLPSYNNEVMKNIVPIKMYEYLALGKPVIASRLTGLVREFGDSSGVMYVDRPEDVPSLALELSSNPMKMKLLKSEALKFSSTRSWDVVVNRFEKLLQELISRERITKPEVISIPQKLGV